MANTQDQTALTASRTELASQVKSVTDADWRAYLTYKLSGLDAIIAAQDPSQDIETLVTQLTEALQGAMQLDFQQDDGGAEHEPPIPAQYPPRQREELISSSEDSARSLLDIARSRGVFVITVPGAS